MLLFATLLYISFAQPTQVTCGSQPDLFACEFQDSADEAVCAPYDDSWPRPNDQIGFVIGAGLFGSAMAFGIGANDIGNMWGTSIGSGAIDFKKAVMLGAFCEWLGAAAFGYGVANTVGKGISSVDDPDCWACGYCDGKMGLFQAAAFCALVGASIFVVICSYIGAPVSTTHSIVGGVVGAAIVGTKFSCLNWDFDGGLTGIIASWGISPVLSGTVALTLYAIADYTIFRRPTAFENALKSLPVSYFLAVYTAVLLLLMKGKAVKNEVDEDMKFWIPLPFAGVAAILVQLIVVPRVRAEIELEEKATPPQKTLELADAEKKVEETPRKEEEDCKDDFDDGDEFDEPPSEVEPDEAGAVSLDVASKKCGDHLEDIQSLGYTKDQAKAVYVFRYLLVCVACLETVAHGANDAANAAGPFSAVYQAYREGLETCDKADVPVWVMILFGGMMALGIAVLGKQVIETIGKDLVVLDYYRAFYIELGATAAVIVATYYEFPVSTTHCKIGAVTMVGSYAVGVQNVQWSLLGKIVIAWVVTIPFAGLVSAAILAMTKAGLS